MFPSNGMNFEFKQKRVDVLDSKLTSNPNFAKLVRSVIFKIFNIETEYKTIYIDLNSCLSILFHYGDINEEILVSEIYKILEKFLSKYSTKGAKLIFLWTLRNSVLHTEIFNNWCKERVERVNITKSTFLKKLIVGLDAFGKKHPDVVKVINTYEVHPAVIVKYIEMQNFSTSDINSRFLILSKDTVFRNLDMARGIIFTGKDYVDPTDRYKPLPDSIELDKSDQLLKYYLVLRGDSRNEYPGIEGYGVKNSLRYINKHKLELLGGIPLIVDENEDNFNDILISHSKLWDIKYLFEESSKRFNLNKLIYPDNK